MKILKAIFNTLVSVLWVLSFLLESNSTSIFCFYLSKRKEAVVSFIKTIIVMLMDVEQNDKLSIKVSQTAAAE